MLGLLGGSSPKPEWALAAALTVPHAMFPAGVREAIRSHSVEPLADPYISLAQETWGNLGFIEGAWQFRQFEREPEPEPVLPEPDTEPEVTLAHAS
jgi:hypothetical protein